MYTSITGTDPNIASGTNQISIPCFSTDNVEFETTNEDKLKIQEESMSLSNAKRLKGDSEEVSICLPTSIT